MSLLHDPVLRGVLSQFGTDDSRTHRELRLSEFRGRDGGDSVSGIIENEDGGCLVRRGYETEWSWHLEILAEPAAAPTLDGASSEGVPTSHVKLDDLAYYLRGRVICVFDHAVWMVVPPARLVELAASADAEADLLNVGVARLWPNLPLTPQHSPTVTTPWTEISSALTAAGIPSDQKPLGKGITWAVIDSDVNDEHQNLKGFVERYEVTVVPDPNDATRTISNVTKFPPAETFRSRHTSGDASDHGTHVAGVFHAVAPEANIVSIALEGKVDPNDSKIHRLASEAHVIGALEWVAQHGTIRGANLSLGIEPKYQDPLAGDTLMCQALNTCVTKGKMVVVAAGNYGTVDQRFREVSIADPANAVKAFVVGACEGKGGGDDDTVWQHSSHGPTADGRLKPDLVAPGVKIASCEARKDTGFYEMSGTSQAAAFVSGACAILLSREKPYQIGSAILPKDLTNWIRDTSVDLAERLVTYQGKGRLNIEAAIRAGVSVGLLDP